MRALGRLHAVVAAAIFMLVSAPTLAQEPPPLSAYGELPDVEDAAISPDGNRFALLSNIGNQRLILFFGPDMRVIRKMELGDAKVRSMDWIGNDRLLVLTSTTADLWGFSKGKTEAYSAHIVPVFSDGEVITVFDKQSDLFDATFGNYGTRKVAGRWKAYFGALERVRGQRQGWPWRGRYLYEVDVETGRSTRIAMMPGNDFGRDWLMGPGGGVAATFDIDMRSGSWSISNSGGTEIASGKQEAGEVGLAALAEDGASVIFTQRADNGDTRWLRLPLAGGEMQDIFAGKDISRLYLAEASGRMLGYREVDGTVRFVDPAHQDAVDKVFRAFAKLDLQIVDWSADFGRLIVRTSGNGDSGTWYVVDIASLRAIPIVPERRKIAAEMVGPISTIEYTASDGLGMDGILTLPPGREARNLPVVLLPHGGPHAHDEAHFDWWAQAFASRGYAVFQPNFRGSTNRGNAFMRSGYGEWGRKMQTDISDGLAELASRGIVDPSRACIVGASYGGYAALAGVTLQNGIYRCAVSVNGASDISALYEEGYDETGRAKVTKNAMLELFGPKSGWNDVSPRRFAARADAPVLLIHGVDDTVVPFAHAHLMADALKDAGKPHELIRLEGEDHWLSQSETRMKMLGAAMRFVQEHNPAS